MDSERKEARRAGTRRTRGERAGGRSERVVREILDAAFAELAASGYAGFRMDEVASRAGVNKTTIYRRWPGKADLVAAALEARTPVGGPLPDTGSIEADLVMLLREMWDEASTVAGQSVMRIFFAELGDPIVQRIGEAVRQQQVGRLRAVLARAAARGELKPGYDEALVAELLHDGVVIQLRLLNRPAEETLRGFVRIVLEGVGRTA